MGTSANVIIEKPQGIYRAAVGTAMATVTGTLGGTVDMSTWEDTGWIDPEGKIKVKFGGNVRKVRPMGVEGPIKGLVNQKYAEVEFMGLEDILENLALGLSGADVVSNAVPDGGDGELSYTALAIVTSTIVYHFKRVAPKHELEKEIDDTVESKIPFIYETYVDEDAPAGERQWNILKRTA